MSRSKWNLIKQSKRFYVNTFRRAGNTLVFSLSLNILFGALIYYFYLAQPEPDYYATYGETSPVPLVAMEEPNYSAVPLLANDTEVDRGERTELR